MGHGRGFIKVEHIGMCLGCRSEEGEIVFRRDLVVRAVTRVLAVTTLYSAVSRRELQSNCGMDCGI